MTLVKLSRRLPRIGWIGFHMEGVPAFWGLLEEGIPIQAFITLREDLMAKRSGGSNRYKALCKRYRIPYYEVGNINDEDSVALLRSLDLDVVFVIGWSQIIRREALSSVKIGMIGAHASLLPHNRGSAPINWAMIKGETISGNTLMWLNDGVDEGDIIDQMPFPITLYDTCATLYDKVAESNRVMITQLIPRLSEGRKTGAIQPDCDEPVLPRRRPQDGAIDWSQSSRQIYNFIRALTKPYPGAFSLLNGKKWTIWGCTELPAPCGAGAKPGQIVGPVYSPQPRGCGYVVACGEGAVIIHELESADGDEFTGGNVHELQLEGIFNEQSR